MSIRSSQRRSSDGFALLLSGVLLSVLFPVTAEEEPSSPPVSPEAEEAHRTYLEHLRSEGLYPTAASCSQCHPDHYEEWSVSPHAYAMLSPVFQSMHAFIVDRTGGTTGDFCIRCHTPVGMEREEDVYGSALLKSPAVREGVTCISCHRVSKDFGTTSGRISLHDGALSDPIYGPGGGHDFRALLRNPDFGFVTEPKERGKLIHAETIDSPIISRSAQCGMCHDVNNPNGLRLESAFTEFKHSPAAKDGTSCQDCHMGVVPGAVLPDEERFGPDGRDRNYDFAPVARVKNSPRDPGEGKATPPRKRTNHMFIGPDYSIVHPGLFPHSVETGEFTYGTRFRERFEAESKELLVYVKKLGMKPSEEARAESEKQHLRAAATEAKRHALTDWLSFRWEEGWGTEHFEDKLSETERKRRLAGVGFPWTDPDDPVAASMRRKSARLILDRQFQLLNRAHADRVRILRQAIRLGKFEVVRDDEGGLVFRIDVHNATSGHAVPTGFDAERVMFLEVTVTDSAGNTVLKSGDRDPNGDLRDLHSAYVHAEAEKSGQWLRESAWKERHGLTPSRSDLRWRPDPFLFSLQSKFINRNLSGDEREAILPVNTSLDPIPFLRPPTSAEVHSGRGGGARKQFRTLPPLSHRTAEYRIDRGELSPLRPYQVRLRFLSQMVPVNLVKEISSVGFDMELSAREVANRVAYGHLVDDRGTRRGGAVTLWEEHIDLGPDSLRGFVLDLSPTDAEIQQVSVADYPFPHVSPEEMARREAALGGVAEAKEFLIQHLGPHLPEIWPGGVPEGLPLLPEESLFPATSEPESQNP